MKEEKEFKDLRGVLSLLPPSASAQTSTLSEIEQTLQPPDLLKILQRLLGDQVHLIDPTLSLKASPLVSGSAQGAGVFLYMQALRQLVPPGQQGRVLTHLTKPIVMLIAQPPLGVAGRGKETKERDSKKSGTQNAWKAIVIVPRNYRPLLGTPVNNDQNPLLYYFDPQHTLPPNKAPAEVLSFCLALTKGCQMPAMVHGRQATITLEPLFNTLGFLHGCQALCDQPENSAWWAIYFAVMAVSRGGVQFKETQGLTLLKLQQVFYPLLDRTPLVASIVAQTAVIPAVSTSSSMASTTTSTLSTSLSTTLASSQSRLEGETTITSPTKKLEDKLEGKPQRQPDTLENQSVPSTLVTPKVATTAALSESSTERTISQSPVQADHSTPPEKDEKQTQITSLVSREAVPAAVVGEQKTLVLPAYTPEILEGVMRAYGIPSAPDEKLPRDQRGEFECVAYPLSALNDDCFLQDALQYWQAKQGRLENRRVAYLFLSSQQCLALVIQWSAPNINLATQLWQTQTAARTALPKALRENKALTRAAPQFYERVQATVLGVSAQSALLTQLQKPLNLVFRGQFPISFKAIAVNPIYHLVLLEDILNLLQQGQTRDIDLAVAVKAHRERCLQAVATRWIAIERDSPDLKQELVTVLRTLRIYAMLQTHRQSRYGLTGEDRTTLRQLKSRDQAAKHYFYEQRFADVNSLLEGLPLNLLAAGLRTPDATEWLKALNQSRDQMRQALLLWEMNLEEKLHHARPNWCTYLSEKATDAWQFLYRSSFVGFGGELFRLAGRSAFAEIENNQAAAQHIAQQEAKLVHRAVRVVTRSASLAARSEQAVLTFLGQEPLSRSVGLLGGGLGGLWQIYLGPYTLGQMWVVSLLPLQIHQRVHGAPMNELKAEIHEPVWSLTALHRLSHLLFHGAEAYLVGSTVPLVGAVGGLAGSVGMSTAARRLTARAPARQRGAVPQETPGVGWLMLSLAGASLGQIGAFKLYGLLISLQHRLLYRETAIALLTYAASHSPGLREFKIDYPALRYSPSLWLSSRNPLSLTWTTQSGTIREAQCDIQGLPVLTPQGIMGLVCEGNVPTEEISTTLGLPRP